jgi:hypothetical protein
MLSRHTNAKLPATVLAAICVVSLPDEARSETPAFLAYNGNWYRDCTLTDDGPSELYFSYSDEPVVGSGRVSCVVECDQLDFPAGHCVFKGMEYCNGQAFPAELVGTYTFTSDYKLVVSKSESVVVFEDCGNTRRLGFKTQTKINAESLN